MTRHLEALLLWARDAQSPVFDRLWYDLTGVLVRWWFGDDGRWGYELDRNPPPVPVRLCSHCGEEVILPGDHIQINDDWYHVTSPCVDAADMDEDMIRFLARAMALSASQGGSQ